MIIGRHIGKYDTIIIRIKSGRFVVVVHILRNNETADAHNYFEGQVVGRGVT